MDVLTAIEKRREITRFKPEPVPPEALDKLIRALHLAPSGNNLPSREFVIVENREMLLALAETPPYMRWLRETAGAAVIFAAPEVSKYWLQDATIAGAFLWLAATSLGLGAAVGGGLPFRRRRGIPQAGRPCATHAGHSRIVPGRRHPRLRLARRGSGPEGADPQGAGVPPGKVRGAPVKTIGLLGREEKVQR